MKRSSFWPRVIIVITIVKILGSFCLWAALGFDNSKPSGSLLLTTHQLAGFGLAMAVVGFVLILPLARDPRAVYLGGFFLTAAAAFLDSPLESASLELQEGAPLLFLSRALWWLQPLTFMPFFLWSFLREFPRRPRVARTYYLIDRIARLLAWSGGLLFLFNMPAGLLGKDPKGVCSSLGRWVGWGLRGCDGLVFFLFVLVAVLASLALLAARAFRAKGDDRRRVALFCFTLVAGISPITATALLERFFPKGYPAVLESSPLLLDGIKAVGSFCLLAMPFVLAYSVVVHRVLDFRLFARRAVHYALARGSVSAIVAVPLGALGWYLYHHRRETVIEISSGPRFLLLASAAVLGIWALKYRPRLLEAVDRHFFREQYDARHVLTSLAERIPRAGSAGEIADLVLPGIERALHPEALFLLAEDRPRSALVDTSQPQRQLDLGCALARLIADHGRPFVLDPDDPRSAASRLPLEDRQWLRETGIRLFVPMVAIDGSLLATIALAGKKSDAPYSSEDRKLLSTIAGSAAPILELHRIRRTGAVSLPAVADDAPREPADWDNARECPHCGQIFLPQTVFCVACDRRLETAAVPYSIPGKLRFERRIGTGGMGVVYRAADMALGRGVAVKTLRYVSADQAMKLRREARTAAAVSHQHLAAIYGVETWHGMPMLVLELFEGMLAQRIAQSPLSPLEALELGISLADALAELHAADILHRDIKPSNIGYTRDGKPKLTDFGIARFIYDLDRDLVQTALPVSIWNLPLTEESAEKLRGTLPYLSPEAVEGQPPNASFDLWSLSIVLYECLIGRKLFVGQSPKQMMTRILLARLPDLRQFLPDAPPQLVDLFRGLLHKDRRQRPESATEMRALLEATRDGLAA